MEQDDKLKNLANAAKKNNDITEKIVERSVTFAQIWFTLIAPIIIGFSATLITTDRDVPLNDLVFTFILISIIFFVLIHLLFTYVNHNYSKKESLYAGILEMKRHKDEEVGELRTELAQNKIGLRKMADIYSNQISTLYLSAYAADMAIGDLKKIEESDEGISENNFWKEITASLAPILQPLVVEREALFSFESESKYNIALYFYDEVADELSVVWRDCDSRLPQRNRSWKPGHGHIGLAFLHKETKLCPDIQTSSELNSSYSQGDSANYRSFMSIPILRCDDDGKINNIMKPLGVLVLTSANPNQFIKERDFQFLSIISKHLAIYLAAVDVFLAHNTLTKNASDAE